MATIRQARGSSYPDPVEAALAAVAGGADQITIHLREDRRHIVDADVKRMKDSIGVPLNLEMAAAEEIIAVACGIVPETATIVPEKRQELTTEGGLDVSGNLEALRRLVARIGERGTRVSFFIDPDEAQIEASLELSADAVEFHTGAFCNACDEAAAAAEMARLKRAVRFAKKTGM
ncbi:MAG TPA: pyridoxine 5'-phosphate synthase, partial [bacterium]|nr:pyridoxine 5'-phosphate synthase [bacterium]